MILDVCNENFLFSSNIGIDIFCFFIIFLCILLCLILKNKKLYKKKQNIITTKLIVFIASFVFMLFIILTLISSIGGFRVEGCYCKVGNPLIINDNSSFAKHSMNNVTYNRIIIVGDSRMEFIKNDSNNLDIPINFSFIAKSGARIEWFEETGLVDLKKVLDNKNEDYHYHVVINMGVNDLNKQIKYDLRAQEYYNLYKELFKKNPNVDFYLLSVNPIEEEMIDDYWYGNIRTNKNIEKFNGLLYLFIREDNLENVTYCDSYNKIDFRTYDGLHYSRKTNQKIINYISDECINYKKSL